MAAEGWKRESFSTIHKRAKELRLQYGLFVCLGYWFFRSAKRLIGWSIFYCLLDRYAKDHPKCNFFDNNFDKSTNKFSPTVQDINVFIGGFVTAIGCFIISHITLLGVLLLCYHLIGIFVYHMNVLAFDELSKSEDPRPWTYRRIFFHVYFNFFESLFIFAGLYQSTCNEMSFGQALFWSLQGLTLNVPYEWQDGKLFVGDWQKTIFGAQIFITLFFVIVLFSVIASSMFKREEIGGWLPRKEEPDE